MKVKIKENKDKHDTTLVAKLIGLTLSVEQVEADGVIIDICGGLKLYEGEYEVVES